MTVIDKEITKENKVDHINNMVGARATILDKNDNKRDDKQRTDKVLRSLKDKEKVNRILLDLLAVSITPKTAIKNWRMIDTKQENLVLLMKRGMFDFKPNGNITELGVEEFFEFFRKEFDGILEMSEEYDEFSGGGGGYNEGRTYDLGEGKAKIHFRYFNPNEAEFADEHYKSGSRFENYLRQKINIKLTGDGLQYLRSQGNLVNYILKLYELFPCDATMFDIALDLFNYNQVPKYYVERYERKHYISRSKMNVQGHVDNPTVYIGAFKGARTIMLYDKLQESKDTESSDEPELIDVLEKTKGNWFRLEQHFSSDRREAEQAFGYIVYTLFQERVPGESLDTRFIELLSSFLKESVENKCRFLSEPKKKYHNERIKTDKRWGEILNAIETVEIDFAFMRPELTLEERMDNYKFKFIGGKQFHLDVINELGKIGHAKFMREATLYWHELADQENKENGE